MEQDKYSVGLDIGTTKIVAIIGKENEYGKIEVLGIGRSKSLGVHRGVVNNITQTIQSIQQAVEEAEVNSGLKNRFRCCWYCRSTYYEAYNIAIISLEQILRKLSMKTIWINCAIKCTNWSCCLERRSYMFCLRNTR